MVLMFAGLAAGSRVPAVAQVLVVVRLRGAAARCVCPVPRNRTDDARNRPAQCPDGPAAPDEVIREATMSRFSSKSSPNVPRGFP